MHTEPKSRACLPVRGLFPLCIDADPVLSDGSDAHPSIDDAVRTGMFGQLCGRSALMIGLYERILRVSPTDASVLLAGETGTGKEVVARTIHEASGRRHQAFVALNCGAVSPTLVESELFGHEQGSFTGATRRHSGVFARADGGTLFLDEITEMPRELQVKLLRALETGLFDRVGGEKPVRTDVRVIAASNRPPEQAVRDGTLRQDLYYRLNVFPIRVPPLRLRGDDIHLLARSFLDHLNTHYHTNKRFAARALDRMAGHMWPGNVRELKNFVHYAYILADDRVDAEALPSVDPSTVAQGRIEVRVGGTLAAAEQQLITATMESLGGRKVEVAKVLGISVKTLYCRLNEYGMSNRSRLSRHGSPDAR